MDSKSTILAITLTWLGACGGSTSTDAADTGTDLGGAETSDAPSPSSEVTCDGSKLLAVPTDTSQRGPWPVGAKTVTLAGLVTEVWYPAVVGSDAGETKLQYDIRKHLPPADASKIPDADNPLQACDCYADLPMDTTHGPYPLVLFIHGTAAFRTQSASQMTHWASRGFVVVAADHPGIGLQDILAGSFGGKQTEDANALLDALATPSGEVAFLAGHLAPGKTAVSGHSAGGGALSGLGGRAKVLLPMAARGVSAGSTLVSTLILGGQDDGVARYTGQQGGFDASPKKKRLVGLANAGHLAFSDLCAIQKGGKGILQIAVDHGITVNPLISTLSQDGCKPGQLAPEKGWKVIDAATSAVLEETLACSTTAAAQLTALKATYAEVGEYKEEL